MNLYYKRPYCENCRLIWSKQSIGLIQICPECNNPLILKDFNPWLKAGLGILGILGAIITLAINYIPFAWVGGFLFGFFLIFKGFKQWIQIRSLDLGRTRSDLYVKGDTDKKIHRTSNRHMSIICPKCSQKLQVPRINDTVMLRCPKCGGEFRAEIK